MSWTTPVTRSAGDVVSAADWNNQVANNAAWLHDLPYGEVLYGNTSMTAGNWIDLSISSTANLRNGMAQSGNGLVVPRDGQYLWWAMYPVTAWGGGNTDWSIAYNVSGNVTMVAFNYVQASYSGWLSASAIFRLAANDTVKTTANEGAGATTIYGGTMRVACIGH